MNGTGKFLNKTPEPGAHSTMGGNGETRNSSNVLRNNFILKSEMMAGLDRSSTFVIASEVGL